MIEDAYHVSSRLYSLFFFSFQCINSLNEIVIEIYQFNSDKEILFYSIDNKYFFQLPNKKNIYDFSCESMFDEKEKRLTCLLLSIKKLMQLIIVQNVKDICVINVQIIIKDF